MTDRIAELERAIIPLAKQADFYKPDVPDYEQVRVPLQFLRAARMVMPGALPDIENIIDGTFVPSPPALSGGCEEVIAHLKASADGEIIRAECFAAGSADDARGQARAETFRKAAALIEQQAMAPMADEERTAFEEIQRELRDEATRCCLESVRLAALNRDLRRELAEARAALAETTRALGVATEIIQRAGTAGLVTADDKAWADNVIASRNPADGERR